MRFINELEIVIIVNLKGVWALMEQKKNFSALNCIGTALLAIFFTVPVHELFHLLTDLAYGDKIICYSAGAVLPAEQIDYNSLSVFNRIMVKGGSASIINAIIGIILIFVVLKVEMKPLLRVFMIQLMGAHLTEGFGYFMIGGFFGVGDWGNVFSSLSDTPGTITVLRIVLSIVGSVGVVGLFFLLNYMSYYFIEDKENKKERIGVAFKLHLLVFILGFAIGMIVTALSPAMKTGELSMGLGALYNMMWIPFFWGFMFTGIMKTLPPKESRFKYEIPKKLNIPVVVSGVILILIDIFVFGPGIFF